MAVAARRPVCRCCTWAGCVSPVHDDFTGIVVHRGLMAPPDDGLRALSTITEVLAGRP
jgi:hypothetical protein